MASVMKMLELANACMMKFTPLDQTESFNTPRACAWISLQTNRVVVMVLG